MSWLRLDDQILLNPKIGKLSGDDLRDLLAVWTYCARRKNGGRFKRSEIALMVYATSKGGASPDQSAIQRLIKAGLIQRAGGKGSDLQVKDWAHYQPKDPTAADRMRRYRDRNADRNETVSPVPSRPIEKYLSTDTSNVVAPNGRGEGWIENLNSYTGCRYVRGTHALTPVQDVLGTEQPPFDWPHPRPTRKQIQKALDERKEASRA